MAAHVCVIDDAIQKANQVGGSIGRGFICFVAKRLHSYQMTAYRELKGKKCHHLLYCCGYRMTDLSNLQRCQKYWCNFFAWVKSKKVKVLKYTEVNSKNDYY